MSKGYEGWVNIRQGNGWGSTTVREGMYYYVDSVDLSPNKEFTQRNEKIVFGRGMRSSLRTAGAVKPGGSIEFQPRSDDFPMVLMSHCQMYYGTVSASVATYTMVNSKGQPTWSGATYGTGPRATLYSTSPGNMFVVDIWRKFHAATTSANLEQYISSFADEITLTAAANADLKVSASFKAYSYGSVNSGTSQDPNSSQGSYSTNSQFEFFSGTMTFAGDASTAIDITSAKVMSKNNSEERVVIGAVNPSKYPFGKTSITGELTMDMPSDGLRHIGSMLSDTAFAFVGTFYNSASDQIIFNMPVCKRDPFTINQSGGEATNEMTVPFTAYESTDGGTAPITWTIITSGLGSAFDIV